MILMTKVDKIDPLVDKDLTNVYRSVKVREVMVQLSNKTGIPMTYIMPVRSYLVMSYPVKSDPKEIGLEVPTDILTLTALQRMLRLADDYFEDQMDLLNINPKADSEETVVEC